MTIAAAARIEVSHIAVDAILVGPRHRVASDTSELAASIARSGLLHPIVVRPSTSNGNGFALVAGANRLAATKGLGYATIPAIVRDFNDLDAELAEIDENLTTNTLTVLEQGEHLVRRSEILREQGLRATVGQNQHRGGDTVTPPLAEQPVTTHNLADQIGVSDRSVQRYVSIANDLPAGVRDLIRGSEVANRTTDLLTLARMDQEQQQQVAAYIGDHHRAGVAAARHALFGEAPTAPDDDDYVDNPGDDVGERYDVVRAVLQLFWKEENPAMRKRVINGEDRFYRRESITMEREYEFLIGVEAFQQDGRVFLCNAVGRQLYDNLDGVWPPAPVVKADE